MTTGRKIALLTLVALGGLSLACSPGYVLRAGWEEAKILQGRRSIHDDGIAYRAALNIFGGVYGPDSQLAQTFSRSHVPGVSPGLSGWRPHRSGPVGARLT